MNRPWTRRVTATATLACVLTGWLSAPADADADVVEVGSWTRNPAAAVPPEGGVAVANAPDGVLTVSAIRFDVGDEVGATMTLRVQQADAVAPAGASVRACSTTSTWVAATNGDFAAAPVADCAAGSVALAADDAGLWSADVSALLAQSASVVLLPAAQSPAVFSLTFDRPVVETIAAPANVVEDEPTPDSSGSSSAPTSDPLAGVEGPSSFSALPSELALAPVDVPILSENAPAAVAGPAAFSTDAGSSASPFSTGGGGSGRDLGQAFRLGLLSIVVGAASVPVLRLKDGQHVPGLSRLLATWTGRSSSSKPGSTL